MAFYRIHRIKDAPAEQFRWTAHTGGPAIVKPKDYDSNEEAEAATVYAVWKMLQTEGKPLRPGDVLEAVTAEGTPAEMKVAKYIGFEPASWWVPEPKSDAAPAVMASIGSKESRR
ncbi:MAG: hypothetical protein JO033_27350 [Acidobacteriaceae bacterium]|nr:hypothetical protein [Acidobacteriaceae bacterium]MBV9500606.1 hypothetical protein [Acidobacteriaceae bacterium]